MEKQQENRIYTFPQDEVKPAPIRRMRPTKFDWFNTSSRAIGLILLLFGLWASVHIFMETLQLYRAPAKIAQLATAIEQGSNLDSSLAPRGEEFDELPTATRKGELRLTYFVAWIVALLLLMLMSMIAFAAMRTGGELVFQDKQNQRLIKLVTRALVDKGDKLTIKN